MGDIITGVVWGDAHSPEHDRKAVNVLCKVIDSVNPDVLIDIGDSGEFSSINAWNKAKPRLQEGQRLVHDLKSMYGLSEEIASYAREDASFIKMMGNHENWVERFIDRFPELEGLPGINIAETYEKLGWDVIPWGEFHSEGKLMFHHGDRRGYQTKWHSGQWASMGHSIVYGHRHDFQSFTHETLGANGKPSKHRAWCIGCLRGLKPNWMDNRKNNWQQGFGIFYIRPGGWFQFYPVDIVNGKVIWNGKVFSG